MGMKYTKEMVDFLEKNIEGTSYKEITDKFNTHFHESVTFEAMNIAAIYKVPMVFIIVKERS